MAGFSHKLGFILVGYPGSGKSTLAKKLSNHLGALSLSSDAIRAELFGTERYDTIGDEIVQQQSAHAYAVMYERAGQQLATGNPVVIDATHLDTIKRQSVLRQLSQKVPAEHLCYVLVNTPVEIIQERMQQLGPEVLADWQRVHGYFLQKEKSNALSWPTTQEGIDCYTDKEIYAILEQ